MGVGKRPLFPGFPASVALFTGHSGAYLGGRESLLVSAKQRGESWRKVLYHRQLIKNPRRSISPASIQTPRFKESFFSSIQMISVF